MKTVYLVASGKIKAYAIVKETPCFFKIVNEGGYKDQFSKDGFSIPHRFGGRSTVTTDILKSSEAAQAQINIISEYLAKQQLELQEAESQLKEFIAKHTAEEASYTKEQFEEFQELIEYSGSSCQQKRTHARQQLPKFTLKHGQKLCDEMYAVITKKD